MHKNVGVVSLIGAGPGDPGLITIRGRHLLEKADVVVYDALANPALLEYVPPAAERIDVGKRVGDHRVPQEQINELLRSRAEAGKRVARLKGGDPYLFGRGAEEVAFLGRHGIPVEVVSGVTAGLAAPATAGIPLTHRDHASTVTFVTGHEDPAKPGSAVDYTVLAGLVRAGGTLCFYMGLRRLERIAQALIDGGSEPETPLAVVESGTWPSQRNLRSTLREAAAVTSRMGLAGPAVIVVGAVAGLVEPGLDWFTSRPLFGCTIVITRSRHQSSRLRIRLAEAGAEVIEAPTIVIRPTDDIAHLHKVIRTLDDYDWLVLTSVNGVDSLARRFADLDVDARHLAGVRVAAIGPATSAALRHGLGVRVDLEPPRFVAESLAEVLITEGVRGCRICLWRAKVARPVLPRLLRQAGAEVDEIAVYETHVADTLPEQVKTALGDGRADWVTFTSSSTVRNMVELLGTDRDVLERVKIASIGPVTSQTIREFGYRPTVEAERSDIEGLTTAIIAAEA